MSYWLGVVITLRAISSRCRAVFARCRLPPADENGRFPRRGLCGAQLSPAEENRHVRLHLQDGGAKRATDALHIRVKGTMHKIGPLYNEAHRFSVSCFSIDIYRWLYWTHQSGVDLPVLNRGCVLCTLFLSILFVISIWNSSFSTDISLTWRGFSDADYDWCSD